MPFRASRRLPALLFVSLSVAACHRHHHRSSPPPLVYTSDEEGGSVIAIDPSTAAVVARIPVGKRPRGLKVSHDGGFLYVALSGSARGGPGVDESRLPPPIGRPTASAW